VETTTNKVVNNQRMIIIDEKKLGPIDEFRKGVIDTLPTSVGLKMERQFKKNWINIRGIVEKYNLLIQDYNPLIILNEQKNLQQINIILEQIKNNQELREYAKHGIDSSTTKEFEEKIDARIFSIFARIYHEFCRSYANDAFVKCIKKPENLLLLKELFSIHGTISETEKNIEEIVGKILNKQ